MAEFSPPIRIDYGKANAKSVFAVEGACSRARRLTPELTSDVPVSQSPSAGLSRVASDTAGTGSRGRCAAACVKHTAPRVTATSPADSPALIFNRWEY